MSNKCTSDPKILFYSAQNVKKKFGTRNKLVAHVRNIHPQLHYKCYFCTVATKYSMSQLLKHLRMSHYGRTLSEISIQEVSDSSDSDDSDEGTTVHVKSKTNVGMIVELEGEEMHLGVTNSSRSKKYEQEKYVFVKDTKAFFPGHDLDMGEIVTVSQKETATPQSYTDLHCMKQCENVSYIDYIGHVMSHMSFKVPRQVPPIGKKKSMNKGKRAKPVADLQLDVQIEEPTGKKHGVWKTFYISFNPYFKSTEFREAL